MILAWTVDVKSAYDESRKLEKKSSMKTTKQELSLGTECCQKDLKRSLGNEMLVCIPCYEMEILFGSPIFAGVGLLRDGKDDLVTGHLGTSLLCVPKALLDLRLEIEVEIEIRR